MNKFAEVKHGRVVGIYKDERSLEEWKSIFSPDVLWLDVTGQEADIGYVIEYNAECGWVLKKPVGAGEAEKQGIIDNMTEQIINLESKVSELTADNNALNDTMLAIVELMEAE